MNSKFLTALPIFNEQSHVEPVLQRVRQFSPEILVVDDGSTDRTPEVLSKLAGIEVITHEKNLGYGAALQSAFAFALAHRYEVLVTIDCDGQHQPELIPALVAALTDEVDMVSGSRYLRRFPGDSRPPAERRRINAVITAELNDQLGLSLSDAFCGFKAYRVSALARLSITETGYAMPLQLWVQAAAGGFQIKEFAVPVIYLAEQRSFGGSLDNASHRLAHYRAVLEREINAVSCTTDRRPDGLAATSISCGDIALANDCPGL